MRRNTTLVVGPRVSRRRRRGTVEMPTVVVDGGPGLALGLGVGDELGSAEVDVVLGCLLVTCQTQETVDTLARLDGVEVDVRLLNVAVERDLDPDRCSKE